MEEAMSQAGSNSRRPPLWEAECDWSDRPMPASSSDAAPRWVKQYISACHLAVYPRSKVLLSYQKPTMLRTALSTQIPRQSSVLFKATFPAATRTLATSATRFASPSSSSSSPISDIPQDIMHEIETTHPMPMRLEFMGNRKLTSEELEKMDIGFGKHHVPKTLGDKFAYRMVKTLRLLPDTYFGQDHYMRAVMLETIAAGTSFLSVYLAHSFLNTILYIVPGMVGGMLRHMRSLRNMSEDKGWIGHLLHEAENERMHLMTWMKCLQPSLWNRLLVLGAQGVFFNAYFWLYVFSPRMAHRMCGYLEEEAVVSYTHFLEAIDKGHLPNGPAPQIAIGKCLSATPQS